MSPVIIAVILGIVEGLTEFLPISSTGHLILVGNLLNFLGDKAATFEIVIQSGAILAVIILFWHRFIGLLDFKSEGEGFKGKEGITKIVVASIPALIVGFLLHHAIKEIFRPIIVAFALVLGGFVMIYVEGSSLKERVKKLEDLSYRDAFIIGLAQCLALWPGVSRSGATIIAGMLLGLTRGVAAEFSFLIAAPILVAATGYELFKNMGTLSSADIPLFAVGFLVSFVSAIIAVKGFIRLLSSWTLKPFAYYRIVLGLIVAFFFKW